MSRYLIIVVLAMFVAIPRICAQSQVRMALPKTQTMVHNSLSKSRANKSKRGNAQFTISKDLLAKMFGFCGISVSNDTTGLALSVDTCATKRDVKKSLPHGTGRRTAACGCSAAAGCAGTERHDNEISIHAGRTEMSGIFYFTRRKR